MIDVMNESLKNNAAVINLICRIIKINYQNPVMLKESIKSQFYFNLLVKHYINNVVNVSIITLRPYKIFGHKGNSNADFFYLK